MAPTYEELRDRAKRWTEAISEAAPGGASAKSDPAYEQLMQEVAKLESVTAGAVDWPTVVEKSSVLLEKSSKDFLVAAYLSNALLQTGGLSGLVTGCVLLAELVDRYWLNGFPEVARIRGRVNALSWFLNRVALGLPSLQLKAQDAAELETLSVAAARLREVSQAKFESNAPAFTPLLEGVARLKLSLPAAAPPPPPPPLVTATAPPPPPPTAPVQVAAAPQISGPAVGALSSAADATDFLRNVGSALVNAASPLRAADLSDPTSYRILRAGLYLHLKDVPPTGSTGRTGVPAPPEALRAQLEKMSANAKWAAVLEESESALLQHRFCLDFHRYSAQALEGLGVAHRPAREALVQEVAGLLKRLPSLPSLVAADGTPLCSEATQRWLSQEVSAAPAGAGVSAVAGEGEAGQGVAEKVKEARTLLAAGQAAEALAQLQQGIGATSDARARFQLRLGLAQLCLSAGHKAVALGLYEVLDRESTERDLESWEPALASTALEGLLSCARQVVSKTPNAVVGPDYTVRYHRLCKLDPAAALRVGA